MSTFNELGLNPEILKALEELTFTTPTPIQEKAIPRLLNSPKDLIALAQTGTGKTAAYSLPVIQQINAESRETQALILCPTRELCIQITKDIRNFIKHSKGLAVASIYGGESAYAQILALRQGAQIVVGTPGRVLDLIKRKKLLIGKINWLIIDEADEILDMGFKEDLDAILSGTPTEKQTMLFSATMPRSISMIAHKYMKNADEIRIDKDTKGAEKIEHKFYVVQSKDRYEALRRIADMNPSIYGIIFCRTRIETQEIADQLIQDNYSAEAIHGDISQQQRTSIMDRFRKKQIQLLVATDVAARGIDVGDLTHIINYQLPDSLETYLHRSGRTGRAGKSGTSLSIVHSRELRKISALEHKVGKTFKKEAVPTAKDVCEKQLLHYLDELTSLEINEAQIGQFLPAISKKLEEFDREKLIKHFVSLNFKSFLDSYEKSNDINAASNSNDRGQRAPREKDQNMKFSQFRIEVGRKDHFGIKELFALINSDRRTKGAEIGHIDIADIQTTFEIDKRYEQAVLSGFRNITFRRQPINIRLAQ
jgi:ATP-dependent RNA helicase DeaD